MNQLGRFEEFEEDFYEIMREAWKGKNIPEKREGEMELDLELKGKHASNSTRYNPRTQKRRRKKKRIKEREDKEKAVVSTSTDEFTLRSFPITLSSLKFSTKEKRKALKNLITKISEIFKLSTLLLQDYYFLAKDPIPPEDVLTRIQGVYLAKTEKRKPSAVVLPNNAILARLVKICWRPELVISVSLRLILDELSQTYLSSITTRNSSALFKKILRTACLFFDIFRLTS